MIREHVLLPFAGALEEADLVLRDRLPAERISQIVATIPDAWLERRGAVR